MSDPIIKLESVNYYYNRGKPSEMWALKNISLEINQGDYVVFFGPSGCGKSSLLYIIAGIEATNIDSGKVLIKGQDVSKFSKKEMVIFRQVGVGIVFQNFNLIPSITVLENVTLPMAFLGVSEAQRMEEGMKLLERLNIKHIAERYPSELSGGQQQRVGIARALANNAPIIIADEPLGNLDSQNANNVLDFLRELNQKDGRTVIMVTHEAWSIKDANKVFYMKDGEIIRTETPKTATATKKTVSEYYETIYPMADAKEITAKSLSNLLLRGYSLEEIKRFEYFFLQRLEGKINKELFMEMLDKSFKEGGVGLWRPRAVKISNTIEDIINKKCEIDEIHKELTENPETPLVEEVMRLRSWLLEEYKGKVSDLQKIQLGEVIEERLRNIISPEQFQITLNLPRTKSGVGFSLRSSVRMAEKLETILVKGHSKAEEVDRALCADGPA